MGNYKLKGKTYEEVFGLEKAIELKKTRGQYIKGKKKEEYFGKIKAQEIIQKWNRKIKGKTYEEIYGNEEGKIKKQHNSISHKQLWKDNIEKRTYYSQLTKNKIKQGKFGRKKGDKCGSYTQLYGNKKANEIISKIVDKNTKWKTKEQVIEKFKDVIANNEQIPLSTLFEEHKKYDLPSIRILYKFFQSRDDLVKNLGIKIKRHKIRPKIRKNISRIGANEQTILDNIEKENNIILNRQYYIDGYYIDGYDKMNNVVYEVQEEYHNLSYIKKKDEIKKKTIIDKLQCKYIEINEQIYLKQLENNIGVFNE